MVVPVGGTDLQELVTVTRVKETFTSESLIGCRFVPLIGDEGW
jgi:protein-L-isoaspartate(D-aspartate) O-methyltransferase